jgi:uncharacterized protein (TIGR02246 family)
MKTKWLSMLVVVVTVVGCASTPGAGGEICQPITEAQVRALFDRWNASLRTTPREVADNYAERSILLPTVSNVPRVTRRQKEEYFEGFLQGGPSGTIGTPRMIFLGCNSAVDSGLYTFTFTNPPKTVPARYTFTYSWDGSRWLITSHHSSEMPEGGASAPPP